MGGELQNEIRELHHRLAEMEQALGTLDHQQEGLDHTLDQLSDKIETEPLIEEQQALQARIDQLLSPER
jgi:chromosome segregation ATPase